MRWIIGCLLAVMMVSPVMAGEDPYIAIVGNDCPRWSRANTMDDGDTIFDPTCAANPFYFSPKYNQFTYNQTEFGVSVCNGTFPPAYGGGTTFHDPYGVGCEQFRSQNQTIQPEVCDSRGHVLGTGRFADAGNYYTRVPGDQVGHNAVTRAGNSGWYEWYIRLPKKPTGEINLVLQCGVLKPNTWAFYEYDAVSLCAAESGERVGTGICSRQEVNAGQNPLIIGALPKITAIAYPGPNNAFTPFHLTAFRNPGNYNPFASGVLVTNAAGQILDGIGAGTRILLKSCMDKTIVTKLPVTGQVNAFVPPEVETDLEPGDIIYVRMDVPRANTVDIYCHAQSAKVMGIGEAPF